MILITRNSQLNTHNSPLFSHFSILIFFFCFLLSAFTLSSIEVGGHLTEDTTWSPDNNPYLVTETLYVDAGVTLTILPGIEIKVSGASCTSWQDYNQNFWLHNGVSVAKMFWIDGRIISEGTEQDSIIFTRMQDDPDFYWGTIYITSQADMSRFEHCKFEYTAGIGIALGNIAKAAISIYNGSGIIKNCSIVNNTSSIITRYSDINKLEISKNIVSHGNDLNSFTSQMRTFEFSAGNTNHANKRGLIAQNCFYDCFLSLNSSLYINNNNNETYISLSYPLITDNLGSYFHNNSFIYCENSIYGGHPGDSLYIKNNQFIDGSYGINLDYAYVEISDNYFEGCDIFTQFTLGKVFNNISNNGEVWSTSDMEAFNNICYNSDGYGLKVGYNPYCANNISVNNQYAIWGKTVYYDNCIILNNNELTQNYVSGEPVFRNCIIDFPLEYPLIDGGGNIIVDSLQAQSIFEDIQNGDFHLVPGSIAIDAGFDTLGYYYPFDLDYNHRVWDGDGNGTAIIDIGPYEYGAPAFGGIQGITYDPINGEPVDYVLIKINNIAGEFTFSDSVGNYQYKLPAGVYDIYAERVFYEDAIEYQIEVLDGEFTQLDIPMTQPVNVEEHEIPHNSSLISHLSNYPNPFNPTTSISFSLPEDSKVELSIYNVKGQKVKTVVNEFLEKGSHTIEWNGTDSNNKTVSSGVYFYQISADKKFKMKKMLLLK